MTQVRPALAGLLLASQVFHLAYGYKFSGPSETIFANNTLSLRADSYLPDGDAYELGEGGCGKLLRRRCNSMALAKATTLSMKLHAKLVG